MSNRSYDVIIAGGSVAGAALAGALCKQGARVLVLEPESQFRDRVRGESFHPWGRAEAERLGLEDVLQAACIRGVSYWDTYIAGGRVTRRDLAASSPSGHAGMNVHHPELQEALLSAAAQAGCEVSRGVRVTFVQPGAEPEVELAGSGAPARARARLIVLAHGRSSGLRSQLDVVTRGETSPVCVSGVLVDAACAEDATQVYYPAGRGAVALLAPLSGGRTRVYLVQQTAAAKERYTGAARVEAMLEHCAQLGVPRAWISQAHALGPLATFSTPLTQLEPASLPRGVVAIGDAAGSVDPAFGCGMSMALRDARCLRDHLASRHDLQLSAAEFARERSAYHGALLRTEDWLRRILFGCGPDSEAVLEAARSRLPQLKIDLIGLGPESPSDARTEALLFEPI